MYMYSLSDLCLNINSDAVNFSECHSKEVISLF